MSTLSTESCVYEDTETGDRYVVVRHFNRHSYVRNLRTGITETRGNSYIHECFFPVLSATQGKKES
jgi:hypothetical protein